MAQEIVITSGLRVSKGALRFDIANSTKRFDLAGDAYDGGVQTIGATHEALDISGDVTTAGYAHFLNLDAEASIEIGIVVSAVFYPFVNLGPGELAVLPLATLTLYAQCDASTAQLQFVVFER